MLHAKPAVILLDWMVLANSYKLTDKTCPICSKYFKERNISKADIETKLTEGVRFFCPNKDENCDASLSLADIKTGAHLNQCPEEMVECPNPECIQGSVNAGNGQSDTRSLSEFVEAEQPAHTENHSSPAKRSNIDTQAGESCQKTTKIKRKNIPEHLESCAKFFTCECDKTFPDIKNQDYLKKFEKHINENKKKHRQTIIMQYLVKNSTHQTILTGARPAVVGEINKPLVLNGFNCFTTSSKYIFQCKKKPNDFILYIPADIITDAGCFTIGTINFQFTHPNGDIIAATGEMSITDYLQELNFRFETSEKIQPELKSFSGNMNNSKILVFKLRGRGINNNNIYASKITYESPNDLLIATQNYHFSIFSL